MSNFIGKSIQPVEVKKIFVRVWALRDEIEAAIQKRIEEEGHSEDSPAFIDDIKSFYDKDFKSESTKEEIFDEESSDEESSDEESSDEENSDEESSDEESSDEESSDEESSEEESSDEESSKSDSSDNQDSENLKTREPFTRQPPAEDKISQGYVLLSDIVMESILIFSDKTFTIGQNIIIEFMVTKPFKVTAELLVSKDIGRNSKIIKQIKYNHRLQSVFLFEFPGERSKLREFLQSIEPEIPVPPKKLKKPESDDDDDFDDLGF